MDAPAPHSLTNRHSATREGVADILRAEIDLLATLRSGQFFRWHTRDDAVTICHGPHRWGLAALPTGWSVAQGDTHALRAFLSLDDDLFSIVRRLPRLPPPIRDACPGLTLLRQTPYEAAMAFLLSSNTHQTRIRAMLGHLTTPDGRLKSPVQVVTEHSAIELQTQGRFGYRASWAFAFAEYLAHHPGYLDTLSTRPTAEIRDALLRFGGIGEKVANCILLFGYRRTEAFPVDVWIARATRTHFPYTRRLADRRLAAWAQRRFGRYAGLVQQLMYAAATRQSGKLLA